MVCVSKPKTNTLEVVDPFTPKAAHYCIHYFLLFLKCISSSLTASKVNMILNFSVHTALSSAVLAASARAKVDSDKLPVTETKGRLTAALHAARAETSPLTIRDIRSLFAPKQLEATFETAESVDNDDVMQSLHDVFALEDTPVHKKLRNDAATRKKEINDRKHSAPNEFDPLEELGILGFDSTPRGAGDNASDGFTPWHSSHQQLPNDEESSYRRELNVVNCGGNYPVIGSGGFYPSSLDFESLVDDCLSGGFCPYTRSLPCWDTSRVKDMSQAFRRQYSFNEDISRWDTSIVTDMEGMFYFATTFNQNIGSWKTSRVVNFESAFSVAPSFNQDISQWDTSKATTMQYMFAFASAFDQDISSWVTSKVKDFAFMFEGTPFNQDISGWQTLSATDMQLMFYNAKSFNQHINSWDISNVANFRYMFRFASSFNQCLSSWAPQDTCVSTSGMFSGTACPYTASQNDICPFDPQDGRWCRGPSQGCSTTTRCDNQYPIIGDKFKFDDLIDVCLSSSCPYPGSISCWDTSRVGDMSYAFHRQFGFNGDISAWDTSSATSMKAMFYYATSFNQDLRAWDTSNVKDFSSMFLRASSFNKEISAWDTSEATSMASMFYFATFFNQNIGSWDTANVSTFMYMFEDAVFFNQDISNWNTSSATTMKYMFANAQSFDQDIGSWVTSNVEVMEKMFLSARSFNQDISSWDTSNVGDFRGMFRLADSFNQCLSLWAPRKCAGTSDMFEESGCPYTTSLDQTCPSNAANLRWCRGPEQRCDASTCRDSNDSFKYQATRKKAKRTTCQKVKKEKRSKRRKTCGSRLETGRRKVSDLCPGTCGEC